MVQTNSYYPYSSYSYPQFNGYQQTQTVPQWNGQNTKPNVLPTQTQPLQTQDNGISWCQGEVGAKAWYVAPGTSALIMDSEKPVFYIKTVDVSGMPLPLRIFDFTERKQEESAPVMQETANKEETPDYITRDEFEKRISELIEAKSSSSTSKKGGKK